MQIKDTDQLVCLVSYGLLLSSYLKINMKPEANFPTCFRPGPSFCWLFNKQDKESFPFGFYTAARFMFVRFSSSPSFA